jgi:hypothetical protein
MLCSAACITLPNSLDPQWGDATMDNKGWVVYVFNVAQKSFTDTQPYVLSFPWIKLIISLTDSVDQHL